MRSGQVRTSSTVAAGGQGCAVPLRHHALIVIGIDGVGDHAALCPLELLGGHAVLNEIVDDDVDRLFRAAAGVVPGFGVP